MRKAASTFITIVDIASEWTGKVAGWAFFTIGFFIMFEVVMRYIFANPTVWVDEVSTILQVWATFLGSAFVLKQRKHITIDVMFREEGTFRRKWVEIFSLLVILFFCIVTAKYGWDIWLKSTLAGHTTDSYLAIPKVYIQSSVWIGFGLIGLQTLAELLKLWNDSPSSDDTLLEQD